MCLQGVYIVRKFIVIMFSGIVEEMGTVVTVDAVAEMALWDGSVGKGFEISVDAPIAASDAYLGCSIAINGTCLTVTEIVEENKVLKFGVTPETIRCTNLGDLKAGDRVNVERSMKPGDRNSGHFVQGHVDGTGKVLSFTREGESLWVQISADPKIIQHIVPKGYVALDGTSLTVVEVNPVENWFTIMLVAYTQKKIIIPHKDVGARINIEVDVLGKYVEKSMGAVRDRVDALEKVVAIQQSAIAQLVIITLTAIGGFTYAMLRK